MTTASPWTIRLWCAAVTFVAAFVGLVAAVDPKVGLAMALGVAFTALVVSDLAVGVALFLLVAFLESVSAFAGLSLAKLAGALLAFSWLALVTTRSGTHRSLMRDHPVVLSAMVALGGWTVMSAAWAELPATALDSSTRWVLNLVLFPIVYAAITKPSHVRLVFALFAFGALLSAGFGLATGTAVEDSGRLAGNGVNANELGELLIVAVILAGALASCREIPAPGRLLALCASGLAVVALLATVSRGAILGLVVALLCSPLLAGRGRRPAALALVVVAAGCAATYLVAVAPRADIERLTSGDSTGTGRTDIWKVGLRMVKANPVLGVGAGNYPNSTIHYLLEPGTIMRSDFIVDDPKVAHNVYLQVLAELGVVGLVLFLGLLAYVLRGLLIAARRFDRGGDRSMEVLSRALLIALCGLLASAFFSSAIYSKQLWLLLALALAIGAMAAERYGPSRLAHGEPGAGS